MSLLKELIQFNKEFVENPPQEVVEENSSVTKLPSREIAILTCMDTRLVNFLEDALGIGRGEAKVLKTAGNCITGPFDGVVRSLLVCIYELGVKELFVIGHYECGMVKTTADGLTKKMQERGVSEDAIFMIQKEMEHWADGFQHPVSNVVETVELLRHNPLIPKDVPVHGLMLHPHSGEMDVVVDGYRYIGDIK